MLLEIQSVDWKCLPSMMGPGKTVVTIVHLTNRLSLVTWQPAV